MGTEIGNIAGKDAPDKAVDGDVIFDDAVEKVASDIEDIKVVNDKPASASKMYHGNAYDLTSLIALMSGVGVLFFCLTCNMGYYVLPFIAIILGIIGVIKAKNSANPERTQLLSWLGIGGGALFILISLLGMALYILLLILIIRTTGPMGYSQF